MDQINFRHRAIIIILMFPAFEPQLLRDSETELNKSEEINNMNIKKHCCLTWDELFTAKDTGIDSKLISATDPSLWHALRGSTGKVSRVILIYLSSKLRKQRRCSATEDAALNFQLKVIGESGMSDFSFCLEYRGLQTGG